MTERITTKTLWSNFAKDFFGWDNKFLFTVKSLLLYPERVFKAYINGTRKRYVAPFTFLAIGTALAMLIFNQYGGEYIELTNAINDKQFELMKGQLKDKVDVTKFEQQKAEQMKVSAET